MAARLVILGDDRIAATASSQRASATVVAETMTMQPESFTRVNQPVAGNPKWKLTTSGLSSSTTEHMFRVERDAVSRRDGSRGIDTEFNVIGFQCFPPGMLTRVIRHRQLVTKKFRLTGLFRRGRNFTWARNCRALSIPAGSAPSPPAFATAIASSASIAAAIGACKIGCSIPNRSSSLLSSPHRHD